MIPRPQRRLVLFLDGTWNEDEDDHPPTNIVRMREILKIGVDEALTEHTSSTDDAIAPKATGSFIETNGQLIEYIVYYDRGVGTGAGLDAIRGGVFGSGLSRNIRQAYRFLSEHYADGDEIYVFGFSRGAFTARSLVGYLFAVGLLKPRSCTPENERRAWRHYRRTPQDRYCAEWFALEPHVFDRATLRVTCLGVFDTVGALGVPLDGFRRWNAEKYAFHSTELSSIVDVSLHAVAIDERRRPFEAALWQRPKFKRYPQAKVEQVWFPGAHADIGGGYADWTRDGDIRTGREELALAWMIARVNALTPGLHFAPFEDEGRRPLRLDLPAAVGAPIHRPWRGLTQFRRAARCINQIPPLPAKRTRSVGTMPHADPIEEAVHVSALHLLNRTDGILFEGENRPAPYRPVNLVAALPAIAATYRAADPAIWALWEPFVRKLPDETVSEPELCMVDWNGTRIPRSTATGDPGGLAVLNLLPKDPASLGLGRRAAPTEGVSTLSPVCRSGAAGP
ncbi:MAG: DUF2235 domain-containing protein [Methylorubrum populi]